MIAVARPRLSINRWLIIGVGLLPVIAILPLWVAYGALIPEEGGHGGMRVDRSEWLERAAAYAGEHRLPDGSVEAIPGEPIPIAAMQYTWIPNVLRMRTGEEYHLQLASVDVIHGFSLQMGSSSLNASVMPGMMSMVELIPTEPGEFLVNCNEYCGIAHEVMSARFIVEGDSISRDELAERKEHEEEHVEGNDSDPMDAMK